MMLTTRGHFEEELPSATNPIPSFSKMFNLAERWRHDVWNLKIVVLHLKREKSVFWPFLAFLAINILHVIN